MIWDDWTLAELKGFRRELAKAIATSALRVKFADREITYRTLDEMKHTATLIVREIARREGSTSPAGRLRVAYRSGFE